MHCPPPQVEELKPVKQDEGLMILMLRLYHEEALAIEMEEI